MKGRRGGRKDAERGETGRERRREGKKAGQREGGTGSTLALLSTDPLLLGAGAAGVP